MTIDYSYAFEHGKHTLARVGVEGEDEENLRFIEKIKDQFFDKCGFAQDKEFNEQVTLRVRDIAVSCGVLDLSDRRQMFAFHNFCPAGLHFYRCSSVEKMVSALSFLNLLWFVDDLLDDKHLTAEESQNMIRSVCFCFDAKETPESTDSYTSSNISRYASAVRDRLLIHMGREWVEEFSESYRKYATSSLKETVHKKNCFSIEKYMKLRMYTSAVFPCQKLLSMLYDFKYENCPEINRARFLSNRIVSFTNDIFSFEKEYNSNSANLIKLLMIERNLPLSGAVGFCVDLINQDISELIKIEDGLDGDICSWKTKFLTGLKVMIQGNSMWSRGTKRYCTPTSPFIELRERYYSHIE
ncbi:alpha-muurolene synthase COP3 [Acrasis kona]|uniref:Terpene synthase n=1 Tax=Acrasis kona TaxID=1008807 RepID=A0AAW2ZQI6_9EUKA